jgi:small subunit ribosomal protein S13
MAEEKQNKQEQAHASTNADQKKPSGRPQLKPEELVKLVRILGKDLRGDKKTYRGLCDINGVSWAFSNAVCKILKLDKDKKIQDLSQEEIKKIEQFIMSPAGVPEYMLNRRKDRDDGKNKHIYGADLDLQVDFDIKRLKKIKSFKGIRHTLGQPVRGQRTKSHFRRNKKHSGGVVKPSGTPTVKKEAAPAAKAAKGGKK